MNIKSSRNVIAPAAQVIVSGIVLFVLYRYLYDHLGIAQIGVWSLVLAATSVSRIGDLGLSAGVIKFVAQALGANDGQRAADVIQTVILTLGAVMGLLLIIGYPLFSMLLSYLLPATSLHIGISILSYALMSLWMMMIVAALSGALDGCMRLDLRSVITAVSHLVFLGMVLMLVPIYGLEGVAIAQVIQSAVLLTLLWWTLGRQLKQLPMFPIHWKYSVLKDMFSYGMKFQIITLMNMLIDPIIKALLSKFGGVELLGYYEMANGLILKCRTIIVEANRVVVPAIAKLQARGGAEAIQLFTTSYRMTFYVSALFYGLLGISMTAISMMWLGHYQATFIQFALLLNLGWFVNTLIGPAYFANLGSGKLNANMVSHVIMGLCTLFFGSALGLVYGGLGVVVGAVVGLIAGGVFLLVFHIKQSGLNWTVFIIPRDMVRLLMFGIFATILSNFGGYQQSSWMVAMGVAAVINCTYLLYGLNHPMRKVIIG